jgi:CubicO group peptidase (beta-lactamase class C family)
VQNHRDTEQCNAFPAAAWQTDSPAAHCMDTGRLVHLRRALQAEGNGVRGFVVVRDGRMVFEHYRHDVAPDDLQEINSVTKSVVGTLVGIALREGALQSVQQNIGTFLPEASEAGVDPRVRDITLAHLLSMTSGFESDERAFDDCLLGPCDRFANGSERLRFILQRPLAHPPGSHFDYDSHAVHLLSVILLRATACSPDRYALTRLFEPLGIRRFEWLGDEDGTPLGGRGITLAPRDMARLGWLWACGGEWRGKRLIGEAFVRDSGRAHAEGDWPVSGAEYGYLWWIQPEDHEAREKQGARFFAYGFGEQFIFVEPRLRLVAAVSSDNDSAEKQVRELYREYVLGALADR